MVAIAILPSVVILPMMAGLTRDASQRQAVTTLQVTAAAVASRLGSGLLDQWREVQRLAGFAEEGDDKAKLRLRLDTIVAADRQYVWVGLADPAGQVLVSSGGLLEGVSVLERPWFKAGTSGDFAGDVHDALLLQKLVAPNAKEPLRLIDFALPVKRADGVPVGVLGAHVRWEAVREMLSPPRNEGSIEIMLVARDGLVLIGPPTVEGKRLPIVAALAAGQGVHKTGIETWDDGQLYLTTSMPAIGIKDLPSFGWSLIVRQPVAVAMADTQSAISRLLPVIAICGAVIVLATIFFAIWVTAPLRRLSGAADKLSAGELAAPVPHERLYREVSMLSDSLAKLDSNAPRRAHRLQEA